MGTTSVRAARRPAAVAVVAVLAIGALVIVAMGRGGDPPVIRLGAASAEGSADTMEAASDDMGMRTSFAVEYRFELTDGARFGAGEAPAWRFEGPADLRDAAATLASRLGVTGEPETLPHGDGSMIVGSTDGSGPSLWIGPTGEWSFSAPSPMPHDPCVELTPRELDQLRDAAPDEAVGNAAAEPTGDGGGTDGSSGPDACEPMQPPAGVPDEAEARRAAEAFFADVGQISDPQITDVWADEWGAWVSATLPVAGQPTDVFLSVAFGPEAMITSASGTLARAVEVGDYPTIDADAAVARLQDMHTWRGDVEVLVDPPADAADGELSDGEVSDGEVSDREVSDGEVTDGEVSILPLPEPPGGSEVMTATLVSAEPFSMLVYDEDQTMWLLPGVRFTDDQGGVWQVLTVADEYLETDAADGQTAPGTPEPAPAPEPGTEPGTEPGAGSGAEPGTGTGSDPGTDPTDPVEPAEPAEPVEPAPAPDPEPGTSAVEEVAHEVVGLPEDEAVAAIEDHGFSARVVARDGEDFAVTDDLRTDRINLRIEQGRVVHADVG